MNADNEHHLEQEKAKIAQMYNEIQVKTSENSCELYRFLQSSVMVSLAIFVQISTHAFPRDYLQEGE